MTGGIFMPRQYAHIKSYESIIKKLHDEGKSYREIGEDLGFSKEQVKECLRRPRRLAAKQANSIPKLKGCRTQNKPKTMKELEKENARLRMENDLLKDFLQATERK